MMHEIFERLKAPFPPESVSWRVGAMTKDKTKARALAYLDARDVMDRLDTVCGPDGWQNRHPPMSNGTNCCEIGIIVDGIWLWKSNGAGASDIEGEKGAYSDAFKRAAVMWGIGRYLYDIDSPWVALDEWKQIEKSEHTKLRALLTRNGAKPITSYAAKKDGDVWKTCVRELEQAGRDSNVDGYLASVATITAPWPDKWQEKWGELIEVARGLGRATH